MKRFGTGIVVLVLAVCGATADLLVYEGFDYAPGTAPNTWDGGTGLSGSWARVMYGAGATGVQDIGTGLEMDKLVVSGGSFDSTITRDGTNANLTLNRDLDIEVAAGTIWISYLVDVKSGQAQDAVAFRLLGADNTRKISMEYQKNNWPNSSRVDFGGAGENSGTAAPSNNSGAYLVVGSFELGSVGGAGTLWILTEAQHTALASKIADGTVAASDLDASNYATVSVESGSSVTIAEGDRVQFIHQRIGNDGSSQVLFDELRMGNSLADVIPVISAGFPVYEGFDYASGTSPNTWNGGTGLSGNWARWLGGDGATGVQEIGDGLELARLEVSGGSFDSTVTRNGANANLTLTRDLDIEVAAGTIWISYLVDVKSGQAQDAVAFRVLGSDDERKISMEYQKNNWPNSSRVNFGGAGENSGTAAPSNNSGAYLVVGSFELGSVGGAGNLWILTEAQHAALASKIADGTVAASDLDASNHAKASVASGSSVTIVEGDRVQFIHQRLDNDGDSRVLFDELRINTDLVAVLPLGPIREFDVESHVKNGQFVISWPSDAGKTATVLFASDLREPFEEIAWGVTSGSYTNEMTEPVGFFRIVLDE